MLFFIMLGMGVSLSPKDFLQALRRPTGLFIGLVAQYGLMPFIGFSLSLALGLPKPIALGLLLLSCMPGGVVSNLFTYFSKGSLALSILMTVTSTVFGIVLIPVTLFIYASALNIVVPRDSIIATLVIVLLPVILGMSLRHLTPKAAARTEHLGSMTGLAFLAFIVVSWVPRNWHFLMTTSATTYLAAIMLGCLGFAAGYAFAKTARISSRDARTVALETGIQNSALAMAIVALTFPEADQQPIIAICAIYALFILFPSTLLTMIFRRANSADLPKCDANPVQAD